MEPSVQRAVPLPLASRFDRHSRSRSSSPLLPCASAPATVRIHMQTEEGEEGGEQQEDRDSDSDAAEEEEEALAAPSLSATAAAAAVSTAATIGATAVAAAMPIVAKADPSSPSSRCSLWQRYRALPRWKRALLACSAALVAVVLSLALVALVRLLDLSSARFRWRVDAVRLNAHTGSTAEVSSPSLCQSAWPVGLDLTLSNSAHTDVRLADTRVDASARWQQRQFVPGAGATAGQEENRRARQLACDRYWAAELAARLPEVFGPTTGPSAADADTNAAARTFPLLSATHARTSKRLPLPSGLSATQVSLLLSFHSQPLQQTLRNVRALSMLGRTRNATMPDAASKPHGAPPADLAAPLPLPPADDECLQWSPVSASVELKFRAVAHFSVLSIPLSRSVELEGALSLDEWLLDNGKSHAQTSVTTIEGPTSPVSASTRTNAAQFSFDSVAVRAFTDVLSAQVCATLSVDLTMQERVLAGAAPDNAGVRTMSSGDAAAAAEVAGKAHEEELFWLRHLARGGVSIGALPPLLTEIGLLPAHSATSLPSALEPPTAIRLITNLSVTADPLERWAIVHTRSGTEAGRTDLLYSGGVSVRVSGCVHAVVDEGSVSGGSQLLQALLDQTWRNESDPHTRAPSGRAVAPAPLVDRVWLRTPPSASHLRARLPCADRSAANGTTALEQLRDAASPEESWRRAVWLWAHRSRMISDNAPLSTRPASSARAAAGSSLYYFAAATVDELPGDWSKVDVADFIRTGGAFNGSASTHQLPCTDLLSADADGDGHNCFLNDLLQSCHLPPLDGGESGKSSSSTAADGNSNGGGAIDDGGDTGSDDAWGRLTDLSVGEPFVPPFAPAGGWVTEPAPISFRTREGESFMLHARDQSPSSGSSNTSASLMTSSSFTVRSVLDMSQMWLRLGVRLGAAIPWLHVTVDVEGDESLPESRGALVLALRPQQVYSGAARYTLDWIVFDRKPRSTSALLQRLMVGGGWRTPATMPKLLLQLLSVSNRSAPFQADSSLLRTLLSGLHLRLGLATLLSRPLAAELTDLLPVDEYNLRPPSPTGSSWVAVAQPLTAPTTCPAASASTSADAAASSSANNSSISFSDDAVHSADKSFSYTDWIQLPALRLTMLIDVFAVDERHRPQGADDLWQCSRHGASLTDRGANGCLVLSGHSASSSSAEIVPSDLLDLAASPCQEHQPSATNVSDSVWSSLPVGHAGGVHVGSWTLQVSSVRGLLNQKLRLRAQMRVRDGRRDTNQSCDSDRLVEWRDAATALSPADPGTADATVVAAQWDTCRYRSMSSNRTAGIICSSAAEYVSHQFLRDGSGDACRSIIGATGCAAEPLWSSPLWLQLRLVPAAAWDWSRGDLALSATSDTIWTSGFYHQPAADCRCEL